MRLVLGFLCLLLSTAIAFAEDGAAIKVAGWVIKAHSEKGQFGHCFGGHVAEPARPGGFNGLGINAKGVFYFSFFTPTWTLPAGQHYPLDVTAGAISAKVTGDVWNAKQIGFELASSTDFLAALRTSNAIDVTSGNFSFRADFPSAGEAIDALVACRRKNSPADATNPFAPKQADAANPFAAKPASPANTPAPTTATVPLKAAGLRTKPTTDQVKAIFAPGFPDKVPNIADMSKYADTPGTLVMTGYPTKQQFDGLIEFSEEARAGKSESAVIEKEETESKSSCTLRLGLVGKSGAQVVTTGAHETAGGVSFQQMTRNCPGVSWTAVLVAIGPDRYQTFALNGPEEKRSEIDRRSKMVFDALLATYR